MTRCTHCDGTGHMNHEMAMDLYDRDGEMPNRHFGCVPCDGTGEVEGEDE